MMASDGRSMREIASTIKTRDDLANFISELRKSLALNPQEWENTDLDSYLEAMEAWVYAMDGYYQNTAQPFPDPPTWKTFGEILGAAAIYE